MGKRKSKNKSRKPTSSSESSDTVTRTNVQDDQAEPVIVRTIVPPAPTAFWTIATIYFLWLSFLVYLAYFV